MMVKSSNQFNKGTSAGPCTLQKILPTVGSSEIAKLQKKELKEEKGIINV